MKSYLIFHGYFKTSLHFYFSAQNQLRIKFAENCFQFTFFFIRSNIILEILSPFIFPIVIFKQISTVLLPSICYNFCPTSFRTSSIIFFDHSTSDGNILTNVIIIINIILNSENKLKICIHHENIYELLHFQDHSLLLWALDHEDRCSGFGSKLKEGGLTSQSSWQAN